MRPDDVPNAEMLRKPRLRLRLRRRCDPLSSGRLESAEWYDVADLLEAAAAPAAASELTGEREIIAAFQREHLESVSASPRLTRRRSPVRSRMLNSLLTGKIAAALAATAVSATGVATAAYADALPDSVQDIAHHLIAAPPAHSHASDTGRAHGHQFAAAASPSPSVSPSESPSPSPSPSPSESPSPSPSESVSVSPSPSTSLDPAAFGLCTAWSNAVAHHLQDQVGFRDKLEQIAGGDDTDDAITTFCATVTKPGDEGDSDDAEASSSASTTASPDADDDGNAGEDGHGQGQGNGHGHGHGNDDAPGHH